MTDPVQKRKPSKIKMIGIAIGVAVVILGIATSAAFNSKPAIPTNTEPTEQDIQNMIAKLGMQNGDQTEAHIIATDVLKTKGQPGATLLIYSNTDWSGALQDSNIVSKTIDGSQNRKITFECKHNGIYSLSFQKKSEGGYLIAGVAQDGQMLKVTNTNAAYGVASVAGQCA